MNLYKKIDHDITLSPVLSESESIQIRAMLREHFQEAHRYLVCRLNDLLNRDFAKQNEGDYAFVATSKNKFVVAFVYVCQYSEYRKITSVFVDPNCRNRGIATNLIDYSMNFLDEVYGKKKYYTADTLENPDMEKIFEKLGFDNMGTIKSFTYAAGQDRDQTFWKKANYTIKAV